VFLLLQYNIDHYYPNNQTMSNHLIHENSPYLLQHAHNPVDWYPYGEEALRLARQQNKPIFLSIGYSACHWCHVMERESFEDPATAKLLNLWFISIKVDREERPDVDAVYMRATIALTGSGGWPMSVFLTPDLEPYHAGTYFPPESRYGRPSFRDVLYSMARVWYESPAEVIRASAQLRAYLEESNRALPSATPPREEEEDWLASTLNAAVSNLLSQYDLQHGGWGAAPKFPQPMSLDFLLRYAAENPRQALPILEKATHALRSMARGGMADLVGGGFCRYSVDADWLVPHFEKMLYDNAQLALVYLHAFLLTADPFFSQVCRATLDFILNELTHPQGGFFSSLDADSEGSEGKFYTWNFSELEEILGDDLEFAQAAFSIQPSGNWEGRIILRRSLGMDALARGSGLTAEQTSLKLQGVIAKLNLARASRVRPSTDDKILVMWNALAIRAFAEAGRYLAEPRYTSAAQRAADFLLTNLAPAGELKRSWREGSARHTAYLEDHAALAWALAALYQSDPNPRWYQAALNQVGVILRHFPDPLGGFFDTHQLANELLIRPKDTQDNATPCGNALAACALLELSGFGDHPEWRAMAEKMIRTQSDLLARYPTGYAQWLIAASFAAQPPRELAVVIPNPGSSDLVTPVNNGGIRNSVSEEDPIALATYAAARSSGVWKNWQPSLTVAIGVANAPGNSPALLSNRPTLDEQVTYYLCENFNCKLPVSDLSTLPGF